MNVIEITDVSKKFREHGKEFYALKDVSFSVKKGEIFGLLGPNGAGKTTLMNIFAGILLQDSGNVSVFGKPIGPDVLEKMNFVASDTKFHWVLPARDILQFYGRVYGIGREERARRIEKLSKIFGIDHVMNSKFSYLSTGERMRLSFVKAMMNNPQALFLDEPTLGLDPDIAIKFRDEIRRMSRKFRTTILLTSHYMQEVEQLCDRIAFMSEGEIVDVGSVDKIKMTNFSSYEAIIKTGEIKSHARLRAYGFRISGNSLRKTLSSDESISGLLAFLHGQGISVMDVETKRPTLEDYFVKMASAKKRVRIGGKK